MDDDAELIRKPPRRRSRGRCGDARRHPRRVGRGRGTLRALVDEAVELIRSGGSNLFPVEDDLIGDLHGRCRRAIHLQCAGGRDTLSLWNLGADEVVGVDFSPRMLELAGG